MSETQLTNLVLINLIRKRLPTEKKIIETAFASAEGTSRLRPYSCLLFQFSKSILIGSLQNHLRLNFQIYSEKQFDYKQISDQTAPQSLQNDLVQETLSEKIGKIVSSNNVFKLR